jgi:hypothetical protein
MVDKGYGMKEIFGVARGELGEVIESYGIRRRCLYPGLFNVLLYEDFLDEFLEGAQSAKGH